MTATPVSLYLDLEKGRVADVEVVAAAAIAFSKAVKELAFVIDPSLDIRLELASGTPGSLSLDTLIRWKNKVDKKTIAQILVGIALYMAGETRDYWAQDILDKIFGKDEPVAERSLTKADIATLADELDSRAAKREFQGVYRELERDPAIKGVGVAPEPGVRPQALVPRTEFPIRSGLTEVRTETAERRVSTEAVRVVLISPVLIRDSQRRWKFRLGQKEFGASVKDKAFLESVFAGKSSIPLAEGIEMDIVLETHEELKDGVWAPQEYDVIHVNPNLIKPIIQADLLGPADGDEPKQ
jgi:hypothetical protein